MTADAPTTAPTPRLFLFADALGEVVEETTIETYADEPADQVVGPGGGLWSLVPAGPGEAPWPALYMAPPGAIVSEADASRVLDKLLTARERADRLVAQAEVRKRQAEAEAARVERWALPALEAWLEANPPKGKRRSRDLEAGRLGWRKAGGGVVVDDEEAAIEWCDEHAPEAVRRDPAPPPRLLRSKIPTGLDGCPHAHRAPAVDRFEAKGPKR